MYDKIGVMKILIIIPAYQAAGYLENVIESAMAYGHDILVVDDGSTDNTANAGLTRRVDVICHPVNKGKGAALKTGFKYAIEYNYDAVITLDSDGQHSPAYIPEFIKAYQRTGADLIIGSRAADRFDMPWDRRLSNRLTSKTLSLFLGIPVEDSQCGYRFITTELLRKVKLRTDRFQLETEIIIKAIQQGFKLRFIPIKVIYGRGFPSSMNRFIDTLRWITMVLEEI
jgi:glycosyltransferase involved in cell wall biosynthesis